jgi:hypothetical protein
MPNSVSTLIEKPNAATQAGAQQRDRHHDRGDHRGPPVLEEEEHHQKDQRHRLHQRLGHLLDRDADELGVVIGDDPLDVRGQPRRKLGHPRPYAVRDRDRIGAGHRLNRNARHRLAAKLTACKQIVGRAEFDPGDIAEADRRTIGVGAQDDVLELLRVGEAVLCQDGGVELIAGRGGKIADLAAGGLAVLLLHRRQRFCRRQAIGGELAGIEPHPHRIFGTEQPQIADALHSPELVDHHRGGDIAELERRHLAALGGQGDDQQEARCRFRHLYALPPHRFGQARFDAAEPVLHVHERDVDVGPRSEGDSD